MTVRSSGLNHALHCPGYPRLRAGDRRGGGVTEFMALGTSVHMQLALAIQSSGEIEPEHQEAAELWRWLDAGRAIGVDLFAGSVEVGVFGTSPGPCPHCKDREETHNGHIDWTDAKTVIDWKRTRWVLPPIQEDLQLLDYALAVGAHRIMRVYYGPGEVGQVDEATLSEAQLDAAAEVIRAVREESDAPDAPLVVGPNCTWCLAREVCPRYQEGATSTTALVRAPVVALTPSLAQDWALHRQAVKDRVAALDGALAGYVRMHGPVAVGDQEIAVSRSGEYEVVSGTATAVSVLVGMLADVDVPPLDAWEAATSTNEVTMPKAKIRALLREHGLDEAEFWSRCRAAGALETRESTPRLYWRRR